MESATARLLPTSKRVPGPKGRPFIGSLGDFRRGHHNFIVDMWREHGDIFKLKLGPQTITVLANPEFARHVLVDNKENYHKGLGYRTVRMLLGNGLFVSEGETWRKQRRLMQPPFTHKSMPAFVDPMVDSTLNMLRRWDEFHAGNQAFEMNSEMVRITMSIIGRTMLGVDLAEEGPKTSAALMHVLKFVAESSFGLQLPLYVPTPGNLRFRRSLAILDGIVNKVIERNQTQGAEAKNLLALLMLARDAETGEGMSASQLRDETITIFLAGHETTALTLTWTWYLLSQNPDIEAKLHAELDEVLGGRTPTADDLARLSYTRMVIEETIRLYPPVWMFPRDAINDDVIGGYHIPAKSMILMCPYVVHRHPSFWDEPDRFEPERFSPERHAKSRAGYFPFGMGPRTCIGNHFALLESQIVLATIAQRYRPRLVDGHTVRAASLATLRPATGVQMLLEKR